MSAIDDQEDLDRLKAWWNNYGNALIVGILLGGAILIGFRYWTQHTEQNNQAASVLYDQMWQNLYANQSDAARKAGESLLNEYSSTPYAGMAALMLARMDFDSGDTAETRKHLQWAVEHARDSATRHAARLRLSRLLLNSGDKDAALALLNVKDQSGFEAEYEELKGDIYGAQGQRDLARSAYRAAQKGLPAASPYAPILKMKLADLGPEKTP